MGVYLLRKLIIFVMLIIQSMMNTEFTPEPRVRLSLVLQETGLKQFELAKRIGVSPATLSHIMSTEGRHGKITENLADAIVSAFPEYGFDREWLMTGEASSQPSEGRAEQTAQNRESGGAETLQMGLFDNLGIAFGAIEQTKPQTASQPVKQQPNVKSEPSRNVVAVEKPQIKPEVKVVETSARNEKGVQRTEPVAEASRKQEVESKAAPSIVNIAFFYSDGSFKMFTPRGELVAEHKSNG